MTAAPQGTANNDVTAGNHMTANHPVTAGKSCVTAVPKGMLLKTCNHIFLILADCSLSLLIILVNHVIAAPQGKANNHVTAGYHVADNNPYRTALVNFSSGRIF